MSKITNGRISFFEACYFYIANFTLGTSAPSHREQKEEPRKVSRNHMILMCFVGCAKSKFAI